jgi:xanthine dehydrogenase YagR molybdenum-binding subunit
MTPSVGKPHDRIDGRAKVTGAAKFSAEIRADGMAHAYLVPAAVSKGRINAIDTAAAEVAPGVIAVITHKNAPKIGKTEPFNPMAEEPTSAATTAPVLQSDEIFWHGQPVAIVVADTFERARHAAALVEVAYDAKPAALTVAAERQRAYPPESIMGEPADITVGDPDGALKAAEVKVDRAYTTPRMNHNAIEPHATTVIWDGNSVTVHDATQFVAGNQNTLAQQFGVKKQDVRVLAPFVGGGFGGKGSLWPHVTLAVLAGKVAKRPVKLALPRPHVYHGVGGRTATEQRVALGATRKGELTALIHTGITSTSPVNLMTEQFTFPARTLYASPNLLVQQRLVKLDIAPPTFMRAPGECPGTFALESALDELSYELGMDPLELRRLNEPTKNPTPKGKKKEHPPYSSRHLPELYKVGAEKFGWAKRTPKPRSMTDGRLLVGMGVAVAYYPAYQMAAEARVRVLADGTAVGQCACHEMGMGTATTQTLALADQLGLPPDKVRFEYGDTKLPPGGVAGGSSQTISVGAAIAAAVAALKPKLLALAAKGSPLAGAKADDVVFADGGLARKNDPKKAVPFKELLGIANEKSVEAEGAGKPGEEQEKFALGSYGVQFCEVAVDPDFGTVRVRRFLGGFDAGVIISPKTARSQFVGGIVMGLGMALTEQTVADPRTGRIVNANLGEYLLPTHADVPAVDVFWLDYPDPVTPLGARGIGEIGITGVAAAVANAVYHATGVRVRDLPITPDKLLG